MAFLDCCEQYECGGKKASEGAGSEPEGVGQRSKGDVRWDEEKGTDVSESESSGGREMGDPVRGRDRADVGDLDRRVREQVL